MIGKYDGLGDKDFESVWAAADAIWKAAFPWRSVIWRLMSWFVLLTDYLVVGFRRATLLFLILLVILSFPTICQARVQVSERVLEWLAPTQIDATMDPRH